MRLGRRAEDVAFVSHRRTVAAVLGAIVACAYADPAATYPLSDVQATLTFDAVGYPPIALAASIDVDLDAAEWPGVVGSFAFEPGLFEAVTPTPSVMATSPPTHVWLGVAADNAAGVLARTPSGEVGGVLPLAGFAKICLFTDCTNADLITTAPLDVVGQGGTSFASGDAVQLTVIGAPWTTGTITVGGETAHGSHAEQVFRTDVVSQTRWFRTTLVTPILISTNPAAYTIEAVGRLELLKSTPSCDDDWDNDADGQADFPDDPGCASRDDFREEIDYRDGALHVVDTVLVDSELVFVLSATSAPTTLRLVAPGVVSGDVRVDYGGVLRMEGGTIGGEIHAYGGGRAIVSGGAVGTMRAFGEGLVRVLGTDFDRPYGPIAEISGALTGTLADGTPLAVFFQRDAESSIVLPEPSLLSAGATALLALARTARRRALGQERRERAARV